MASNVVEVAAAPPKYVETEEVRYVMKPWFGEVSWLDPLHGYMACMLLLLLTCWLLDLHVGATAAMTTGATLPAAPQRGSSNSDGYSCCCCCSSSQQERWCTQHSRGGTAYSAPET